ncbi:unnamed protein product [Aspergillus niger]|uniref:Contig An18c0150, genomic contig n=1 Tax=Aspergillus niger (strain ATCC MYA-4892 / CBS 513.88 / FGSC A1513) TaxID=425011 RepID=A2RAU5_ASPNC|nr:unnamed protein product [Aspergillus niger]
MEGKLVDQSVSSVQMSLLGITSTSRS